VSVYEGEGEGEGEGGRCRFRGEDGIDRESDSKVMSDCPN